MNRNQIGARIKASRKKERVTQQELADCLYLSRQAISDMENGKFCPKSESLPIICNKLNVTFDFLILGLSPMESINSLMSDMKNEQLQQIIEAANARLAKGEEIQCGSE